MARFDKLSKRIGVPEETLNELFNEYLKQEKPHKDLTDAEKIERAENRVYTKYKKSMLVEADNFEVFYLGGKKSRDNMENFHVAADKLWGMPNKKNYIGKVTMVKIKGKQVPVLLGKNGEHLDPRRVYKNGKTNDSFGHKLQENNFARTLYFWAFHVDKNKKTGPKVMYVDVNGELADPSSDAYLEATPFKVYEFRAKFNEGCKPSDVLFKTKATSVSKFYELKKHGFKKKDSGALDVKSILSAPGLSEWTCKLSGIKHYMDSLDPKDYNNFVITSGLVVSIDSTRGNNDRMYIDFKDSASAPVKCWCPKTLSGNIGEGSKVFVCGALMKDEDDDGEPIGTGVVINIFGIWSDPIYQFERPVSKKEVEVSEPVITDDADVIEETPETLDSEEITEDEEEEKPKKKAATKKEVPVKKKQKALQKETEETDEESEETESEETEETETEETEESETEETEETETEETEETEDETEEEEETKEETEEEETESSETEEAETEESDEEETEESEETESETAETEESEETNSEENSDAETEETKDDTSSEETNDSENTTEVEEPEGLELAGEEAEKSETAQQQTEDETPKKSEKKKDKHSKKKKKSE